MVTLNFQGEKHNLLTETEERSHDVCKWRDNKDYDHPGWTTSCHEEFCLIDGTLTENHYIYCPKCGGKIKKT